MITYCCLSVTSSYCVYLECGRSGVRAPVGSNQRL